MQTPRQVHLALATVLFSACLGQTRAADDRDTLEQRAFRAAVDRVAPAVVRIETVGGGDQVGRVEFGSGATTGLVIDSEGYIVSSAVNFLNTPDSILVRLPDGLRKPARLVATDHNRMLVLLKIETDEPLPVPETVPDGEVRVGQWAIAVGRTFDLKRPNMSVGIIRIRDGSSVRPAVSTGSRRTTEARMKVEIGRRIAIVVSRSV